MKQLLLTMALALATQTSFAETVSAKKWEISPSTVSQVVTLVDKHDPGSSNKKLSIVVVDNGMSTDMSPRYRLYLGYASMAEMGNLTADFEISTAVWKFESAQRKSAGIYIVKFVGLSESANMESVTLEIDATKMFSDEAALRKNCGGDFCDGELKTSIKVKSL